MTEPIRRYEPSDESAVIEVWHRSVCHLAQTLVGMWQPRSLEHSRAVFFREILPNCDMWVGVANNRVVAYLAMRNSYIDRLYVDPPEQRKGWGSRLIEHAKALNPGGLELRTLQDNHGACALYEWHGFVRANLSISRSPESMPEVEYHWRPSS